MLVVVSVEVTSLYSVAVSLIVDVLVVTGDVVVTIVKMTLDVVVLVTGAMRVV